MRPSIQQAKRQGHRIGADTWQTTMCLQTSQTMGISDIILIYVIKMSCAPSLNFQKGASSTTMLVC
eukprot:2155989-Amphidinium_carterae.1